MGQADEFRIRAADRQRGNHLAWLDPRDTVAEPIHHANQIPPRREGQRGRLGMNTLARQYVGQGDACGQHFHPHLTTLRLGALFFNHPKRLGPAVVSDDDARVFHRPLPRLPGALRRNATITREPRPRRGTRRLPRGPSGAARLDRPRESLQLVGRLKEAIGTCR